MHYLIRSGVRAHRLRRISSARVLKFLCRQRSRDRPGYALRGVGALALVDGHRNQIRRANFSRANWVTLSRWSMNSSGFVCWHGASPSSAMASS